MTWALKYRGGFTGARSDSPRCPRPDRSGGGAAGRGPRGGLRPVAGLSPRAAVVASTRLALPQRLGARPRALSPLCPGSPRTAAGPGLGPAAQRRGARSRPQPSPEPGDPIGHRSGADATAVVDADPGGGWAGLLVAGASRSAPPPPALAVAAAAWGGFLARRLSGPMWRMKGRLRAPLPSSAFPRLPDAPSRHQRRSAEPR